jgi:hypothetical protein
MKPFDTPAALYERLKSAWSKDSSGSWTADNPAKGQCSVTALVVHDIFGGDILKTRTPGGTHFYNRIGGSKWDMTVSQFDRPIPFEDLPSDRDEAMADTSPRQYEALRRNLGLGLSPPDTRPLNNRTA